MPIIQRIPGASFTLSGLPKLLPDPMAVAGTEAVYDALNAYSWPKQAAPAAGDLWRNLVEGGPSAQVIVAPGWTPGAGFLFGSPTTEEIRLPDIFKRPTNDPGFTVIGWVKWAAQQGASTFRAIMGYHTQVSTEVQWGVWLQPSGLVVAVNGTPVTIVATPVAGTVYQVGISYHPDQPSGSRHRRFLNGLRFSLGGTAGSPLIQPSTGSPQANIGKASGLTADWDGVVSRLWLHNHNASGLTPDDLVAADYAANWVRLGG